MKSGPSLYVRQTLVPTETETETETITTDLDKS